MLYQVRNSLHYTYFKYRTRGISTSPPIPCDPEASCEVHTMLSASDVPLYLVAIKSLLRFYRSVGVVIHSDGSLRDRDEVALRRHVPNCRIISASEAADHARQSLGEHSNIFKFRNFDASYRRLVDTELWSSRHKRIIMDSDVLVLQPPYEVIQWIEHGDAPFLFGQPPRPRTPDAPSASPSRKRHVQDIFKENLEHISGALSLPPRFLDGGTGGFYGCTNELTLDKITLLVEACLQNGIDMSQWGGEQCTVIYLLSVSGANRLDQDETGPYRYLNFSPHYVDQLDTANIVHFYGTHRFYKYLYPSLASKVVADLHKTPRDGAHRNGPVDERPST